MNKFFKIMMKHKVCVFITVILIVLLIPIVINESYKIGKGYITIWGASDVLSFYGSFISFIGTVILGLVAVWQNNKAHKLNVQLQKLQQAQYVSMIMVSHVTVEKRSSSCPNFLNTQMPQIDVFDLTKHPFDSQPCYHIDVEIKNNSMYPIVQMQVHPGERGNGNGALYGLKNLIDHAIYIPENGSACFRFIVPCKMFDTLQKYSLQLSLNFINVFDYMTPSNLHITDLRNNGRNIEYQYRLLKFIDVRPNS